MKRTPLATGLRSLDGVSIEYAVHGGADSLPLAVTRGFHGARVTRGAVIVGGHGEYVSTVPVIPAERPARQHSLAPTARQVVNGALPLVIALRPKQWLKNGLLCLAFAFSIGQTWSVGDPDSWLPLTARLALAIVAFSAIASATYLINDLRDIDRDRLHPKKRRRPLASGTLQPSTAIAAAVLLVTGGGALAAVLGWQFSLALAGYLVLTVAYSLVLKQIVILDLLALSGGFVVRAVAGALVIAAPVSPWLYLCTLLGALLPAMAKRRHELTLLAGEAAHHRAILAEYTTGLLDQMVGVVAASTVITYALYAAMSDGVPRNHAMLLTVPFVLYGIFRFMYLVQCRGAGGSPEEVFLRDRPLQVCGLFWVVTAMVILALFRS